MSSKYFYINYTVSCHFVYFRLIYCRPIFKMQKKCQINLENLNKLKANGCLNLFRPFLHYKTIWFFGKKYFHKIVETLRARFLVVTKEFWAVKTFTFKGFKSTVGCINYIFVYTILFV